MKNQDRSKDNKPLQVDLSKMQEKFKEPDDYSVTKPEVIIEGCTYQLYDDGSLSYATPKLLSETISRLRKITVSQ